MRKKVIEIGGKKIEIEISEVPISMDDDMTPDEYCRKREKEKAYDAGLDKLAIDISNKLGSISKDERTYAYWQMGKLISEFIRQASTGEDSKKELYQAQNKAYERLIEKINEIKKRTRAVWPEYSVPYLKKWDRLGRKFSEDQAKRQIPYPLIHELLYDELDKEDIDYFLDRCEKGEFNNISLRDAVVEYRKKKKIPMLDDQE